jgi:hypothetical protein
MGNGGLRSAFYVQEVNMHLVERRCTYCARRIEFDIRCRHKAALIPSTKGIARLSLHRTRLRAAKNSKALEHPL